MHLLLLVPLLAGYIIDTPNIRKILCFAEILRNNTCFSLINTQKTADGSSEAFDAAQIIQITEYDDQLCA